MTNVIVLTGAPATGKSWIAERLSAEKHIPVFSKDAFKIELYEQYGFRNHDEKKRLSNLGEAMLLEKVRECVVAGKSVIIDNNFKVFDAFRSAIAGYERSCNIICIFLFADSKKLADRYNERIASGNRQLPLYVLNLYPVVEGITEYHKPLTADQVDNINKNVKEEVYGQHICRIDTTRIETDSEEIYSKIADFISEHSL